MPADSRTQQQQHHEHACDTFCVLAADSYMCPMCFVWRVVCYYFSTNAVFDLLQSLVPPMTHVEPNPDAFYGREFNPKMDPLFLLEADLKT